MKFKTGIDRHQASLFPVSLDATISQDNEVRLIDLFVESLDMLSMGFKTHFIENGRPAYHPKDLLKLFIYGYLNRIRSSRGLEKESKRNIEVMWLLHGLSPDHNTINNFRKDHPKAIKKVFRSTVEIARSFDMIGGLLIAGDGTKLRAQNSKKNNYNQKKIQQHLEYIDKKLEEYTTAMILADQETKEIITKKIAKQQKHKAKYQGIEKELEQTNATQLSTSDPESRKLILRGVITEVAYNIQSTVDDKYKIPIDYLVTNSNDKNALEPMVKNAITIIGHTKFDALFDKGYYNAQQLYQCHQLGVETYVAIPKPGANAPDKNFNLSNFKYNKGQDTYNCPVGQTLITNGSWYQKKGYKVKQYKTKQCKNCPLRTSCTKSKSGRIIERHEFAENIERNRKAIESRSGMYKQRQAIVEHPFGTIKRQWGYDHIMTKKTMKHAAADVGLIFVAYNLKRIFNTISVKELHKVFKRFIRIYTLVLSYIELQIKYKRIKLIIQQPFIKSTISNIFSIKNNIFQT